MKTLLPLLLLPLLSACAVGHAGPRNHREFLVTVDEASLSDQDVLAVTTAVFEWQSFGVPLTMVLGSCSGDGVPGGNICVRGETLAEIVADTGNGATLDYTAAVYGAVCELNPGASVAQAAHEIGHGMGLIHTGTGTVMCAFVGCVAPGVTAADKQQWDDTRE